MTIDVRAINDLVQRESAFIDGILQEVRKVVVGQEHMIERVLIGLLTGGHVLLEGLPGLGKTELVKALSRLLGLGDMRGLVEQIKDTVVARHQGKKTARGRKK